jgi:hypothetical protein
MVNIICVTGVRAMEHVLMASHLSVADGCLHNDDGDDDGDGDAGMTGVWPAPTMRTATWAWTGTTSSSTRSSTTSLACCGPTSSWWASHASPLQVGESSVVLKMIQQHNKEIKSIVKIK